MLCWFCLTCENAKKSISEIKVVICLSRAWVAWVSISDWKVFRYFNALFMVDEGSNNWFFRIAVKNWVGVSRIDPG